MAMDKIVEVICRSLGCQPEDVKDEATLGGDLGADDLDGVQLVMDLEEEFEISIPNEDWCDVGDEQTFTVKQVREVVQKQLAKKR